MGVLAHFIVRACRPSEYEARLAKIWHLHKQMLEIIAQLEASERGSFPPRFACWSRDERLRDGRAGGSVRA
jgi:hypothetical protein